MQGWGSGIGTGRSFGSRLDEHGFVRKHPLQKGIDWNCAFGQVEDKDPALRKPAFGQAQRDWLAMSPRQNPNIERRIIDPVNCVSPSPPPDIVRFDRGAPNPYLHTCFGLYRF